MIFELVMFLIGTVTTYVGGVSTMTDDERTALVAEWIVYFASMILVYTLYSLIKAYATRVPLWCLIIGLNVFLVVNVVGWCNAREDKCTGYPSQTIDATNIGIVYMRDVALPTAKTYFSSLITNLIKTHNTTSIEKK